MKTSTIALSFVALASTMGLPKLRSKLASSKAERQLTSDPSLYGGGAFDNFRPCADRWGCNDCAEYGVCVWVDDHFGPRCQDAYPIDDCSYPSMHCSPSQCPVRPPSMPPARVIPRAIGLPVPSCSNARSCGDCADGSHGSCYFDTARDACVDYQNQCKYDFDISRCIPPGMANICPVRQPNIVPTVVPNDYILISSSRACEANSEGITRNFGETGFTLDSCRSLCNSERSCEAFDFFSETGWCNLFDRACSNPREMKDGSSSFQKKVLHSTPSLGCSQCVSSGHYYFDVARQQCVNVQSECAYAMDISQCIPPSFSHFC